MRRGEVVAASALLLCLVVQTLYYAYVKSSTYDEPIHALAGYYALSAGDFSVDYQHPPLARMWCALPLLGLRGLRLPGGTPEAADAPSLFWGPMFMWKSNPDGVFLTWLTRLPMIALVVGAGAVLYAWARRLYGRRSALLALFLYAFSPAVLGYGPLTTTDFPAAAMSLFAGFAIWAWLERPSLLRSVMAGLAIGLAWGSKISALFLGPALLLVVLCRWVCDSMTCDEQAAVARWRKVLLWGTALVVTLCFVSSKVVGLVVLGLWLGRIAYWQEACGWGPALRRAAHGSPMLCVGVICYVGLRLAMVWAGNVAPLGWRGITPAMALLALSAAVLLSWLLSRRSTAMSALRRFHWESLSNWVMRTALVVAVAAFGLWACYGFECRPRQRGDRQPWLALKRLKGPIPRLAAVALWRSGNRRLPLRAFFSGIEMVRRLSRKGGHGCGMLVATGAAQWAYFAITLLTKTPCALLVLLLMSTAMAFRRSVGLRADELPVIVLPLVYLAMVLRGQITDGLRHLLPLYPFAMLWASRVLRAGCRSRAVSWAVAGLAVWYSASVFSASPHFLAYFNEVVGGPEAGADWFRDANLDWGQDLRLLARYQARHPEVQPMGLAYFGTADPRAYGVRGEQVSLETPWPGYVAASVTLINDRNGKQAWLRSRPIVARIGGSIRVYGCSPRE